MVFAPFICVEWSIGIGGLLLPHAMVGHETLVLRLIVCPRKCFTNVTDANCNTYNLQPDFWLNKMRPHMECTQNEFDEKIHFSDNP